MCYYQKIAFSHTFKMQYQTSPPDPMCVTFLVLRFGCKTPSPLYTGPPCRCSEVSKVSKRYPMLPSGTQWHPNVPYGVQKVYKCAKRYTYAPMGVQRHTQVPKGLNRCPKVPNGVQKYPTYPKVYNVHEGLQIYC
jgi:hypothetical protein